MVDLASELLVVLGACVPTGYRARRACRCVVILKPQSE
jgi:hypothetical protein